MKKLLITGGSGTVGRSFIKTYRNKYKFFNISRNETLQHSLKQDFPEVENFLSSIENSDDVYSVFDRVKPDIVLHCAAMKHVDTCEKQPIQAINTNLLGSLNIIDACISLKVPVSVFISTDKSARPTNNYGMTKFLMERCVLEANSEITKFAACRFANVACSNGSVIPLWKENAKKGIPIKITNRDMNRMMFSPLDSSRLIEKAIHLCNNGTGGFIISKKMKNVNIGELADLISKKQLVVGERAGEKLDEDLVSELEVPYTHLIDNDYILIKKEINKDLNSRLSGAYNSKVAEKMSQKELMDLINYK
jgi:FlaA1/EpsC-like NDP-sugar epimerase